MGWRLRLALAPARLRALLRTELFAELSQAVESGEPLPEALAESAREQPSGLIRSCLSEIARRLGAGDMLSASLEGFEPLTGPEARPVLRAAERSDRLPEALCELEQSAELSEEAGAALRDAWIGPAFALMLGFAVLGLLVTSVLPTLRALAGPGAPWWMRVLPGEALGVQGWAVAWLVLVAAGLGAPRWLASSARLERLARALPLWGPLRESAIGLHATRALARLLAAGVPLHEALEGAADVLGPGAPADELRGAARLARDGESPAGIFGGADSALPPVLRAVLAACEGEPGLAASLESVAAYEEAELERRAGRAVIASSLLALGVAAAGAGGIAIYGWAAYFASIASTPF
jgi:type II secretory pathway component PulF